MVKGQSLSKNKCEEEGIRPNGTTMTYRRSTVTRKFLLTLLMNLIPTLLSFPLRSLGTRTRLSKAVPATCSRLFNRNRRREKTTDEKNQSLSWETFDYGGDPKWDPRFDDSRSLNKSNKELDEMVEVENGKDEVAAQNMNEAQSAWQKLSPDLVERATQVLLPLIASDRAIRIKSVLKQRTQQTRFLFENPSNPSNVWACLRTIESFGIQYVDVVIQSSLYKGKAAISQKRGMRTAVGSAQWLSIGNHASSVAAVKKLREEQNCLIYASDLNPTSKDIRTIDWTSAEFSDRSICIVMGNENAGISEEMRELVDGTFTLPMSGFAESYNLSVATAITLAHLSAASQGDNGPLRPGDLQEHEYNCLFLKGLLSSVAQKRVAFAVLRREGIELPKEFDLV
jgi:tRNA G18 (ribose-2'-O)-methylase SpoU